MYYLEIEHILYIHDYVIKRFGGRPGLHDLGLLYSAVARPQAGIFGHEAYPDIFIKGAVLFHSLIQNHSFLDGNKRTAVLALRLFLKQNDYPIITAQGDFEKLALDTATSRINEQEITQKIIIWHNEG
jgi:death-on-curing protein